MYRRGRSSPGDKDDRRMRPTSPVVTTRTDAADPRQGTKTSDKRYRGRHRWPVPTRPILARGQRLPADMQTDDRSNKYRRGRSSPGDKDLIAFLRKLFNV